MQVFYYDGTRPDREARWKLVAAWGPAGLLMTGPLYQGPHTEAQAAGEATRGYLVKLGSPGQRGL